MPVSFPIPKSIRSVAWTKSCDEVGQHGTAGWVVVVRWMLPPAARFCKS